MPIFQIYFTVHMIFVISYVETTDHTNRYHFNIIICKGCLFKMLCPLYFCIMHQASPVDLRKTLKVKNFKLMPFFSHLFYCTYTLCDILCTDHRSHQLISLKHNHLRSVAFDIKRRFCLK